MRSYPKGPGQQTLQRLHQLPDGVRVNRTKATPRPRPSITGAIAELAEACQRDIGALFLDPEELEEIIGLAGDAVNDPPGPAGQRIQALVDREYDQFVASLPIQTPKASPTGPERRGSSRNRRKRTGTAGPARGQVKPPSVCCHSLRLLTTLHSILRVHQVIHST